MKSPQKLSEDKTITTKEYKDDDPEFLRKILIIKLSSIAGILFTFSFGIYSLFTSHFLLAGMLLLMALILVFIYYQVRYKEVYTVFITNSIVYLFLLLFLYLVYSGGVENTGALWIYGFPALALFLHGIKKGLIDIALFTVFLMLILLFCDENIYTIAFKIRLFFSFMIVSALSAFYEYSSTKSFEELRILTQKLIDTAKQDYIAELTNRRGVHEEMEHIYQHAKEHNEPLSVMLCDIDYLHDINNRYGLQVGDMVIQEIAKEIQKSTKNTATVARWSGDEFLILLPHTKIEDAYSFSKALSKRIENLNITFERHQIKTSLSIGISDISMANSIYSAIRQADHKMYQVKHSVH